MSRGRVLIVDDDLALLQALPQALRLRMPGVTVDTADSGAAALDRITAEDYDAIVTDIKMPGMDGLELLAEIRTRWPDTPTLMITGHGEHDLVVDALRAGAYDFIQKPIDRDYFVASLRRAIEMHQLSRRVKEQQLALERHLNELEAIVEERTRELRETNKVIESPLRFLMGPNGQMEKIVEQIKQVADSPLTVLVEGETGTGKELVARASHQLSARREKPLVAVAREVRAGRFRQDVYYRLNEFGITLPPLRERDDILHLANEFLPEAGMELGRPCRKISEAAARVLLRSHWPGNVRELRNVIRRAILLASDVIEPEHLSVLPVDPSPEPTATALRGEPAPVDSSLREIAEAAAADAEQQAIRRVLQVTSGNKSEAARLLRTDYKTLYLKMKQYGIDAGRFRELRAP